MEVAELRSTLQQIGDSTLSDVLLATLRPVQSGEENSEAKSGPRVDLRWSGAAGTEPAARNNPTVITTSFK